MIHKASKEQEIKYNQFLEKMHGRGTKEEFIEEMQKIFKEDKGEIE